MAMPVQVGALRGGRKILRPYKWEEIEGIEGIEGVEGRARCGVGVGGCGWVWGMDLLKLNNMLIFVE